MSKSSSPSKTGWRHFHAHEVNTAICKAIGDVRQRAKRTSLETDAELIMACAVAADIWRHHDRLFSDLSEIKHYALRSRVAATLWNAVNPVIQQVCDLQPTTREGYRARAAVFLTWDAEEMLARAETGRIMDRLNLAVVLDLL